ncbi:MAG TPA: YciI family protein [Opitutaceae bacterium]|nr:YciI family protein [Opitutaceae bacterium]
MSTESNQYLFILRQPANFPNLSPEEMQKVMAKWMSWIEQMKSKGQYVGGHQLDAAGNVLSGPKGRTVTDRPFAEAKEVVGGYMIIKAKDLEHATEIARDCPGLERNEKVEVRPLIIRPA